MAERARVLLVDDDEALVETLADGLHAKGFDVTGSSSSVEAARRLDDDFDVMVTDLRMPAIDGMGLLARSRAAAPERPVIVMTAFSAVDTAIESIRQGAYHYLTKPFKVDELALFLHRALDDARVRAEAKALRKTLRQSHAIESLVGGSPAMRDLHSMIRRLAGADVPVLVLGETGTGKGLIARALHGEGPRAAGAFVTVNCAALPDNLLESELFGHARGAFTGATHERRGLFEEAEGGTLFLDEIGEMPATLQAKLLDVLERGVVRPLGSNKERAVDARIVAATHRDLERMVREGKFREDLRFRLDVVTVEVPPLRHRRDDIPALAVHFLGVARAKHPGALAARFSPEAMELLLRHPWPGNVRELEHVVSRAVLLGRTEAIGPSDLPRAVGAEPAPSGMQFGGGVMPLVEVERRYAAWALEQLGGRKGVTAEQLDIDRKTLAKLLEAPSEPIERPGGS